jgi:sigma-E factor negative regulatory protein RseC
MLVEVSNDLQAKEGDYVEISVPEGTVLKLSFLVYIIPVIALLIGAFAGAAVAQPLHIDSALASVLGSGLFMGVSFIVLKRLNTNAESSGKYYPRMIRIVNSARP